jgi:glycosyltransferase involved in cell wall biosynthesis
MTPTFTIVTPSFRQIDWLKLCAASIADQQGVSLEHIVQDAGSGPELETWAAQWERERPPGSFRFISEKDAGMYDAVNRGLKRATGEIIAYLNCDEQYLPGTLADVEQFFSAHPQVDVLFGYAIVVDAAGGYLCSRPVVLPTLYHTQICTLGVFTAATFFRRSLLEKHQLFFDESWRVIGDAMWVTELLRRKIPMAVRRRFFSTFTETGDNLSAVPAALAEQRRLRESAPRWAQKLAPLWVLRFRLRRLFAGIYWPRPLDYAIYTTDSPGARRTFHVENPTFIWKNRLRPPAAA